MNASHLQRIARRRDRSKRARKPTLAQLQALAKRLDAKIPKSFLTFATTYGDVWFGSGWGFYLYDHDDERDTEIVSLGYYGALDRKIFAFKALHIGHAEYGADIFLVVEKGPYRGKICFYSTDAMEHGILEEPSYKVLVLLEDVDAPNAQLELLADDGVIGVSAYKDIDDLIACIRYEGDDPSLEEE